MGNKHPNGAGGSDGPATNAKGQTVLAKPPTAGKTAGAKGAAPTPSRPNDVANKGQGGQATASATAAGGSTVSSSPAVSTTTTGSHGSTTSSVATSSASGTTSTDGDFYTVDHKLLITDFDLLKVLGKGAFGKVMLVKKKSDPTGTQYAMKTLRKAALVKRNQVGHVSTERYILENINCPFLVHLQYAFQTSEKLYMVLDYMAGGEIFFWLKKEKKFTESRARLYAAEITVALEYLHAANIIYRDLKPENILLDAQGHIKLADFGLAKGGITGPGAEGGTKTFCGTPEYLAPEILENKGHGKAVDWWALGTFLFEMITGLPPFFDTNVQRMYHKVLHDPLKFPKAENRQVSEPAKDILRRLLERKVSDRLGSGPTDANELKYTPFFGVYDFNRVVQRGYEPEFLPPSSANSKTSDVDVQNFDQEFTREKAVDSMVDAKMTESMADKSVFTNFTYKPESALK